MDNEPQAFDRQELELFLQEQRRNILERFTSVAPVNRSEAEIAISLVYRMLERPVPKFKWVDNPWMVAPTSLADSRRGLPFLISKAEESVGHRVRKSLEVSLNSAEFNEFFQLLWNNLPLREVRALSTHLEAERFSLRDIEPDSFGQSQTIRQFSFFARPVASQFSSWTLEIEWATETLIRLALAQAVADHFKARISSVDRYQLDCFLALANSVHAYKCFDQLCVLSDRPIELHVDPASRLHNSDGATVRYKGIPDIYSWHGARVPSMAIMEEPTINRIDYESNIAVRRVLIERYGVQNYLLDSGAEIRHHDECGTLYVTELRDDESIVMVHVTNSTPEPDGEFRNYFLRVPPNMMTAREAVAWTFGITGEEYGPQIES
ncbi:hypothetical protein BH10CYA1_BH10CYA1_25110 [soil metagenome]